MEFSPHYWKWKFPVYWCMPLSENKKMDGLISPHHPAYIIEAWVIRVAIIPHFLLFLAWVIASISHFLLFYQVLDVEFHNVKALYRRAQAYVETGDFLLADVDIKKALEVDPQNRYLKRVDSPKKITAVLTAYRYRNMVFNFPGRWR